MRRAPAILLGCALLAPGAAAAQVQWPEGLEGWPRCAEGENRRDCIYVVPGDARALEITACGGGGGGGRGEARGRAGGGGSGAAVSQLIVRALPGRHVEVVIGAGGMPGGEGRVTKFGEHWFHGGDPGQDGSEGGLGGSPSDGLFHGGDGGHAHDERAGAGGVDVDRALATDTGKGGAGARNAGGGGGGSWGRGGDGGSAARPATAGGPCAGGGGGAASPGAGGGSGLVRVRAIKSLRPPGA
jgi:hypothetical protein